MRRPTLLPPYPSGIDDNLLFEQLTVDVIELLMVHEKHDDVAIFQYCLQGMELELLKPLHVWFAHQDRAYAGPEQLAHDLE